MSRLFEALQTYAIESSGEPLRPAIPTDLLTVSAKKVRPEGDTSKLRTFPSDQMISMTAEHSLAAEKFRFLAVRLRYMQQRNKLKRILVTSSIAEEGKSFVATNLAVTLARKQRQKVLLIEGDLRRPAAATAFGLRHIEGICESLTHPEGGDRVVLLEEANIWFLAAGSAPENPLELLQSGQLAEQMNRLSATFDWIIVDAPPILPLADSTVWSRLVDGVLVVAREGTTERTLLKRTLEALGKASVIGAVLNSCSDVDHANYYQRYGPYHPRA